jgi:cytidylate kinase
MPELIVTIDGPAGVGKSTVSRMVARKLGAAFLDTGAMYRALTLAAMRKKVDLCDTDKVLDVLEASDFAFVIDAELMRVAIDGEDVTEAIREPAVTAEVKHIARAGQIRCRLVEMQRRFAEKYERIITEGRDQGTVAFADAEFKFFLTAELDERTKRRVAQHAANGKELEVDETRKDIEKRDASDISRSVGPLTPAEDAIIIDTTNLDAQGVTNKILSHIEGTQRWTGTAVLD